MEDAGREAIDGALAAMTGIAQHINAMKRRHEHAVRVQEIQSLLYGWPGPDLTTFGELIAEGRFRMRGAKAPRYAFLFEKMLLLTKKKEDGLLVYKDHISVGLCCFFFFFAFFCLFVWEGATFLHSFLRALLFALSHSPRCPSDKSSPRRLVISWWCYAN